MESVGQYLRRHREARRMSLEEVARATRVPISSMERIEAGQFDELPGEVFVRGFLKAYARAIDIPTDEVLARYTASRRMAWVTPLPISSPPRSARSGRFGVAIAFVLLLFLFALALSIVLKPRSHDMPQELSGNDAGAPELWASEFWGTVHWIPIVPVSTWRLTADGRA
jgi:cytoskeletal protein RodZ